MEANNKAMCEALDNIVRIAKIALTVNSIRNSNNSKLWRIIDKCKSAFSIPLRNCDVGTAEEQAKRWEMFCIEHHEPWKPGVPDIVSKSCECPCFCKNQCNIFIWAQMPYEEGSTVVNGENGDLAK